MTHLHLSYLGGFRALRDGVAITGFESNKVRALLAYLAAKAGRTHSRETLAALLWPEWPQQSAMSNLRYSLSDLRKNIGDREAQPPFLLISRDSLGLNLKGDVWIDVERFENLAGSSDLADIKEAVDLYQGEFLSGFSVADSSSFEQWMVARREQLQRLALQALAVLVEAHAQKGNFDTALPYARRQVELAPWHEPSQMQLIRLLALTGDRSAALAQSESMRKTMLDELGLEPSSETKQLVEAIREEKLKSLASWKIDLSLPEARSWSEALPPEPGEPLTRREREILVLLAQGLTGPEVAERLRIALSSVRWHIRQIYTKLSVNSKKQALNRARELGLVNLTPHSSVIFLPPLAQPAIAAQRKPNHNLPTELTSFIGREKEISDIKQLFIHHPENKNGIGTRLLTLTGAGGSGKTRLALQVASQVISSFPDGVWLVEFAPIISSDYVPQTILKALGLVEQPGRPPMTLLVDFLREKQILLILDDCEHLIQACAQLAQELLRACPMLHILTTSRETLQVPGELSISVLGLSTPDIYQSLTLEALGQYEAVRLFVTRAKTALPEFELTENNSQAMTQVCQHLDGIPLAIELAAVCVKVLRVEQIAARLGNRFRLLRGGTRTALPRHQTLQATIDWSYNLLTAPEQVLLRRLAVFRGGWSLEAAEAVFSVYLENPNAQPETVLDLLTRLVNKSMVIAERRTGQEARYRILETIRQYAMEKLEEAGEESSIHDLHLVYFLRLVEEVEPKLRTRERLAWLKVLRNEQDNLFTALSWALSGSSQTRTEQGLRLASALGQYWMFYGLYNEGRAWLEAGLAQIDQDEPHLDLVQAKALCVVGVLAGEQGDLTRARQKLEESIAIYRGHADRLGQAVALIYLGKFISMYDDATAYALVDQSLTLSREVGNMGLLAWSLAVKSIWSLRLDKFKEDKHIARSYYEESLALYRQYEEWWDYREPVLWLADFAYSEGNYTQAASFVHEGLENSLQREDKTDIWNSLAYLGSLAYYQDDFPKMESYLLESLPRARELGSTLGEAWILRLLGIAAKRQSHIQRAAKFFLASLSLAENHEDRYGIHAILAGMAGLAVLNKKSRTAARLLGAVEALSASSTKPLDDIERTEFERDLGLARSQLDEASFELAWAEGRGLVLDQVIEEILAMDFM